MCRSGILHYDGDVLFFSVVFVADGQIFCSDGCSGFPFVVALYILCQNCIKFDSVQLLYN